MASSDYLAQYESFQKNRVKPEDYIKKYSTELGVDTVRGQVADARAAINATQGVIKATPDSVSGRTSQSLVTDAQRNRLVQNELQPLNEALSTQSSTYGELQGNLGDLVEESGRRSNAAFQADETQAGTLKDLYDAAFQREKEDEARRQWEAQMAEQRRQFDAQLNESRRQAARAGGFSPSIGGKAGSTAPAVMTKKSGGGGFAFADKGGQSISAAKYAQLTGQDIRTVLYTMGQQGDSYASAVYNQLRQDPFFGKGNAQYDARVKSTYSPLFWGT